MTSFNDIKHLFPVIIGDGKDYREALETSLDEYCSILSNKREENSIIEFCKAMNKQILTIVDNIRIGAHSRAFTQLGNILKGTDDSKRKYGIEISDLIQEKEGFYYRMRKIEDRRIDNPLEMFHIPFDRRSMVSTERYSFPGLPCLYLGVSSYICWEEMGRPNFSQVMISAFKTNRKLKLLDLRAPVHRRWEQTNLKVIPLLLSCQVTSANRDAKYKSEYIIPQLMMEYIITNHNNIDGIMYSSVFKDKHFDYPVDKFYNIALPAIQGNKNERYSNKLKEMFLITTPTCEEYERLNRHIGIDDLTETISKTSVPQNRNYEISIFNEIERCLKDENLFPLQEIIE